MQNFDVTGLRDAINSDDPEALHERATKFASIIANALGNASSVNADDLATAWGLLNFYQSLATFLMLRQQKQQQQPIITVHASYGKFIVIKGDANSTSTEEFEDSQEAIQHACRFCVENHDSGACVYDENGKLLHAGGLRSAVNIIFDHYKQ